MKTMLRTKTRTIILTALATAAVVGMTALVMIKTSNLYIEYPNNININPNSPANNPPANNELAYQKIQTQSENKCNNGICKPIDKFNIAYGEDELQKLDLFYNENLKNAPIIAVIHGGGWISGNKTTFHDAAKFFRDKGYVAMVPNYRIAPEHKFPSPMNDVACSIAWIKNNADKYGADKSKVIIFGNSAGTHIGAMISYNSERNWLEECGIKNEEVRPAGFIGLSGVYDFDITPEQRRIQNVKPLLGSLYDPQKWGVAEPINFVTSDDPPALLIHGNRDNFVNYQNSIDFSKSLKEKGVYAVLDIIDGYFHNGPGMYFTENKDMQQEAIKFINYAISNE